MRSKTLLALIGLALLAAAMAWWLSGSPPAPSSGPPSMQQQSVKPADTQTADTSRPLAHQKTRARPPASAELENIPSAPAVPEVALSKLDRLEQVRTRFSALANGDPKTALKAARELTDDNERETALLALVTAWRHGELKSPSYRAAAIGALGLEAGLGLELTQDPDLAVLWANQLTEGSNRVGLLKGVALQTLNSDPATAIALSNQLSGNERREFLDDVLTAWAGRDTDAALGYAQQIEDATERQAAMDAIWRTAPVGIGAQLQIQDGYPLVGGLLPGTPAELSGQLHPGDRIVAVAQGDNRFVDAGTLPLADVVQMIRGAPGTMVQLQIVPADAAANSVPRTVNLVRDQIRHKQ